MNPTIESWKGTISEIGAAYPFVGTEFLLVIVAFIFWIVWHIIQLGQEGADNQHILEDMIDKQAVESSVQQAHQQSNEDN